MERSNEQLQKIVDAVAERLGAVHTADPAGPEGTVAPEGAATSEGGGPGRQSVPMVQLPPEFYRSQRDIAERLSRVEERMEQFDRRFEELIHQIDKRFEQMDKRFDELIHYVDKRFDQIDKRFEQIDKRFDDLIHYVDKRFATLQWTIGIGFTVITVLMTVYTFLG